MRTSDIENMAPSSSESNRRIGTACIEALWNLGVRYKYTRVSPARCRAIDSESMSSTLLTAVSQRARDARSDERAPTSNMLQGTRVRLHEGTVCRVDTASKAYDGAWCTIRAYDVRK